MTTKTGLACAALLTLLLPATAAAIPPGGPTERRDGATVTITPKLVAPGGDVTFTGAGFGAGTVVSVKLDDGLLLPTTPAAGADVFQTVTASGSGEISGTLDLDAVRPADRAAVQDGAHRLRLLSSAPAHSVHADFAVTALPAGPPEVPNGAAALLGPPADQLLDFPFAGDPDLAYPDVPRLVAGSVVPYRFSGFLAGQAVTLKQGDGATVVSTAADGAGGGHGYAAADTTLPGTSWLRFLAGPAPDNHSIRAPYAVVPNDGRDVTASLHAVPGGAVAFTTTGLVRSPADYIPLAGTGQTLEARLGDAAPVKVTAAGSGVATGLVPVAPGTPPGLYDVLFSVGFAVQNDFPQAAFVRKVLVDAELPAATAALGAAEAQAGTSVPVTLAGFARSAGGGQQVAVAIDGGPALACVDTDVQGGAGPAIAVPAALAAGAHTVRFRAGDGCVAGGAVTQAPAREVTAPLTVAAAPSPGPSTTLTQPTTPAAPTKPSAVKKPAIGSAALKARGGRVTLVLRPGSRTTKATVVVRTRAKLRLGGRARVLTLARRTLTLRAGGKALSASLTLSRDGRALLERRASVAVQIRVTPVAGVPVSRNVTLRR
jgi:hypothetical protein